jgi:hypothetical protein
MRRYFFDCPVIIDPVFPVCDLDVLDSPGIHVPIDLCEPELAPVEPEISELPVTEHCTVFGTFDIHSTPLPVLIDFFA